ncbi:predicted protein [Histoplasma capsulatum G186AR]|uniref:Uncharacterized protein n=1 Tax=Ajellomyces capsulatus (strain G186AR / H82 / ATCC MYA-2454 / RMSCC 2432) TaxID=447093 RepID=C0NVC8_AJECG|nr:uncharacterized protein HCBG_07108 [Histoplasma capsulatum G186AR]EEH04467.1 predicted protein [Histoplasma capsulatum G186AR]
MSALKTDNQAGTETDIARGVDLLVLGHLRRWWKVASIRPAPATAYKPRRHSFPKAIVNVKYTKWAVDTPAIPPDTTCIPTFLSPLILNVFGVINLSNSVNFRFRLSTLLAS